MLLKKQQTEPWWVDRILQRSMWNFLTLVEAGSFTLASKRLGVHKGVLSRQLAQLEHNLGVLLIARTTRQFRVTPEGQALFDRIQPHWRAMRLAVERVTSSGADATGLIRVTAPEDWGNHILLPLVRRFQEAHPHVRMDLHFSNDVLDLVRLNLDLAFRMGKLEDSRVRQRRIGKIGFAIVASPELIRRFEKRISVRAIRQDPSLLRELPRIDFGSHLPKPWEFHRGGQVFRLEPQRRLMANHFSTILELARSSQGIARVPEFLAESDLRKGKLIRLDGLWSIPEIPVQMAFPPARPAQGPVRVFADWVIETLG
jgi:LysR family transcriptional regulator for bpeEF and oprC